MHTFYQDFIERLTALHQRVLSAIDGLNPEALDWISLAHPSGPYPDHATVVG